ncbi:rhamnosyltransferase WsaF family glycosyltransferase [Pseudokordiimonas caeni]|uniref:rhamnosyltransferase WsaF family glycosyltransferase n=1 Tax=Pseudokordiimonas caeni TaxID=2997908 RepID=UPI002811BA25|nr:glycosyltransferase [Pseudokordiimonas caeni]
MHPSDSPLKKLRRYFKRARLRRQVLATGLFDRDWYLAENADVRRCGLDPVLHYIVWGEGKGLRPNPWFDPVWYAGRYMKNGKAGKGRALRHYAKHWRSSSKDPCAEFSASCYRALNADLIGKNEDPLAHYLTKGRKAGAIVLGEAFSGEGSEQKIADFIFLRNSPLIDRDWYLGNLPAPVRGWTDPVAHYVGEGALSGVSPNRFFDTKWYKAHHGHELAGQNPLAFYLREGAAKGHSPGRLFDPQRYLAMTPEAVSSGLDPLSHYLTIGQHREGGYRPGRQAGRGKKSVLDPDAKMPRLEPMRDMVAFAPRPLAPENETFNPACMNIHWVIPDFAPGGGGHMTIFRMINHLEFAGHKVTVWINHPRQHNTPDSAYQDIIKHFQHFAGDVHFVSEGLEEASGDAIIATDCWTVWPVMSATRFKKRFYFIQDFEPSFFPMGSHYLAAEETYRQDMHCICASPWLASLMQEKYGREADAFWLAADMSIYSPATDRTPNTVPRIAVYARHFTARRAVELAMLALETLAKGEIEFEVDFFGADIALESAPFQFVNHGVASPEQLATIFRNADIGLVFSATNYSLVPQEMMACGLPVVELDGDNTRAIFPETVVKFTKPHPLAIASALEALLVDPTARQRQASEALKWVNQFTWGAACRTVEQAIVRGLKEVSKVQASGPAIRHQPFKASVVIPTFNPGDGFEHILKGVLDQRAPWRFEVLVIDSGSTDNTIDIVRKYPTVSLHQIPNEDFNHGDTRNLGASLTSGEFIAYITHDALPVGRWLFNLVTALEHYPDAAGAFGKHLAWPGASPFTQRDMTRHFDAFDRLPVYLGKDTNPDRYAEEDPSWRQKLHFYSDNNSCFRRSVWEKIPYPRTKFGEDQLWADAIIKAGYGKVYAPRAVVYHSHDYDPQETEDRHFIESAFFKHFFGYELMQDEDQLAEVLENFNAHDRAWAEENGIPESAVKHQARLTKARLRGMLRGARASTAGMF